LNSTASKYVIGSAFHLYEGKIYNLSVVHNLFPRKDLLFFTEMWIGAPGDWKVDFDWHIKHVLIGSTRNYCRVALEWNLATDENYGPHTDHGGCSKCLGGLTISPSSGKLISINIAYYNVAHFSKFVRPGSTRIYSTNLSTSHQIENVAFKTSFGAVVVVLNSNATPISFQLEYNEFNVNPTLPPFSAGTFVFRN